MRDTVESRRVRLALGDDKRPGAVTAEGTKQVHVGATAVAQSEIERNDATGVPLGEEAVKERAGKAVGIRRRTGRHRHREHRHRRVGVRAAHPPSPFGERCDEGLTPPHVELPAHSVFGRTTTSRPSSRQARMIARMAALDLPFSKAER